MKYYNVFFIWIIIFIITTILIILLIILLISINRHGLHEVHGVHGFHRLNRSINNNNNDDSRINIETPIGSHIIEKSSTPQTDLITKIAIINKSTNVSDGEVKNVIAAVQKQVNIDFFPHWDVAVDLVFFDTDNENDIPSNYWLVVIIDNADIASALGYHTITNAGMPIGKIFTKVTESYGIPWSLTFSHEVLEMISDPYADISVFVRDSTTSGLIIAYENADACQSLQHAYTIDGVVVSDSIFPSWFGFYQSEQYDFMGYITEPLSILPGGYVLAYRVPNNGSEWEVFLHKDIQNEGDIQNQNAVLISPDNPKHIEIKSSSSILSNKDSNIPL